jgi:DNA-binding transcriptional LysR family regulator
MGSLDGLAIAARETRHEPATRPPRSSRGAMDWDDVRVFLAVARQGSMRAAGRALGLSQPTIARRLAAFEATFGAPTLFDRLPEGLRLSAAGERLVPAAESVENAVLTLERRRAAASPVLSGTVRVSTGECAAGFLAKAGTFACAVYRRRGADAGAWVTYTDEQAHYAPARWVQRRVEETGMPVALRASSMLMHLEAIRAGTGRGVLPCYVGDGHPLLERLTPPIPEIAAEYWIIVHRDLRRAACVRAVIDWMKALFAEQRDVLAGVA